MKSSLVQDLKKQIEEKDNEIGLLKEVLNSTKTMIKVKDKDLSRLKLRIRQLEGENTDLLGKYSNLESLFQDIMEKN